MTSREIDASKMRYNTRIGTGKARHAQKIDTRTLWGRRDREICNAEEILDTLFGLMRKEKLSPGDKTRYMVCESLLDRGFGRAPHTLAAAIQHHTGLDGTALHLEGAAMSPLLQAAHAYAAGAGMMFPAGSATKAVCGDIGSAETSIASSPHPKDKAALLQKP